MILFVSKKKIDLKTKTIDLVRFHRGGTMFSAALKLSAQTGLLMAQMHMNLRLTLESTRCLP